MEVYRSISDIQRGVQAAKDRGLRVGFVATMGALHDGHLSLVEIARQHAGFVIASVFVNPTQFAPGEDFDAYPRDEARDLALLEGAGVGAVYLPIVDDIYPDGTQVTVKAGDAAKGLETDFRPHFFDGVCSVVHRLFEIVKPDAAVFGEKDYQQLMVIREMALSHGMGVDVIGAPIVRDAHGLALSSRNAYLSADEIEIARKMNVILQGERPTPDALLGAGFDKVDYIDARWGRILAAAWIGETRLIDNVPS